MRLGRLTFAFIAALLLPGHASAEGLAAPTGRAILSVSGDIERTNAGEAAVFDLAMLDALVGRTTTTETPWYEGARSFSGPLLSSVLAAVGARGEAIRIVAINKYAAEIPLDEVAGYPVILATRLDGSVMSVRDKGPMFVIFPFSEAPELYNDQVFNRSVWQVTAIEVF